MDILGTLNELLFDNCLIAEGTIDTFTSEAIERTNVFLCDCGVNYTSEISYFDHIAAFAWIEHERPILFMFQFE